MLRMWKIWHIFYLNYTNVRHPAGRRWPNRLPSWDLLTTPSLRDWLTVINSIWAEVVDFRIAGISEMNFIIMDLSVSLRSSSAYVFICLKRTAQRGQILSWFFMWSIGIYPLLESLTVVSAYEYVNPQATWGLWSVIRCRWLRGALHVVRAMPHCLPWQIRI